MTMKIDFKKLVTIREMVIPRETVIFTRKTRKWCRLPYPGHRSGCPNVGKSDTCPLACGYREEVMEKYNIFTLVYATFDFKTYKKMRKKQHPEWSEKQVKNVLYWQGSVKKLLKEYIKKNHDGMYDELFGAGSGFWGKPSMEAAGIYVLGTLKKNDIPFEVKPENVTVMVSLLMSVKKKREKFVKLEYFASRKC
jgi:predicted metal-binding protein